MSDKYYYPEVGWAVLSTKVPRYFFGTGTGGTFSKMVPVPRYIFQKYSVFSAFCYQSSFENQTISLSLEWS